MDGRKLARIRRCESCRHWRTAHATVWEWPHCTAISEALGQDIVLSDDCMEGPDTGCPLGYWKALPPIDLAAEDAEQRRRAAEQQRTAFAPFLRAAMRLITGAEGRAALLVQAVGSGLCLVEIAEELAAEFALDLDGERDIPA